MAILQWVAGAILGVISGFVLIVGSLFAIPSILRYLRIRSM